MTQVASAFSYPFKAGAAAWLLSSLAVLLWPLGLVPLLGYAIAAVRASAADPAQSPPAFRLDRRLISDGAWTALAAGLFSAPFAIAWWPLSSAFLGRVSHAGEPFDRIYALLVAGLLLALPWGVLLLIHMPAASARFAAGAQPKELFDIRASLRSIRESYGV